MQFLQVTVALSHNEKRGTSSEKSADGKRRRRGRRKSEERRKKTEAKIFLAQTLHHTPLTHLRRLTDTTSTKRGKEGATREGRLSLAHIQHVLKKFADGNEEEKRQQKVKKKYFWPTFNLPFASTPPYHTLRGVVGG